MLLLLAVICLTFSICGRVRWRIRSCPLPLYFPFTLSFFRFTISSHYYEKYWYEYLVAIWTFGFSTSDAFCLARFFLLPELYCTVTGDLSGLYP